MKGTMKMHLMFSMNLFLTKLIAVLYVFSFLVILFYV